jgi:TonB family protein
VNHSLLCTTVAAFLLATNPVFAAAPAPAPAVLKNSALADAFASASADLRAAYVPKEKPDAMLERLATFEFSPESAQKLKKLFGTERPLEVTHVPAPKGKLAYHVTLAPLDFLDTNDIYVQWAPLSASVNFEHAGRTLAANASWPSLTLDSRLVRTSVREVSMKSLYKLGMADMWFGKGETRIDTVRFDLKGGPGTSVVLHDTRIKTEVLQRAKLVDMKYGMSIKAIEAAGDQVEAFTLAMRVVNIDGKALQQLRQSMASGTKGKVTPAELATSMTPLFQAFGRSVAARGTAIDIDDLSARLHGNTASLKGRIGLQGKDELVSLAALGKRIVAHVELRVPVAMVQDVAAMVARKQSGKDAAGSDDGKQMGQSIADVIIGKLVSQGYARVDNGVLRSAIDFKDGQLRVNGKEIAFNLHNTPVAAAPAINPPQKIYESCKRPAYPEEALRLGQSGTATLKFRIGTDGHVSNVTLAHSSGWPLLDQASIAAVSACVWTPMMRDGMPEAAESADMVVWDPKTAPPPIVAIPQKIFVRCQRGPYPPEARRLGQSGQVGLQIAIDAEGHVSDVHVTKSSGWPVLDQASVEAARACAWTPYEENGKRGTAVMNEAMDWVLPAKNN